MDSNHKGHDQKAQGQHTQPGRPAGMSPGDEAPAGTPGAGENICPDCSGTGHRDGSVPCSTCGGTGRVIEAVGGA